MSAVVYEQIDLNECKACMWEGLSFSRAFGCDGSLGPVSTFSWAWWETFVCYTAPCSLLSQQSANNMSFSGRSCGTLLGSANLRPRNIWWSSRQSARSPGIIRFIRTNNSQPKNVSSATSCDMFSLVLSGLQLQQILPCPMHVPFSNCPFLACRWRWCCFIAW